MGDTSPWFPTPISHPVTPPGPPPEEERMFSDPILDPTRPPNPATPGREPYWILDTNNKNILGFNGARIQGDRAFGQFIRYRQANVVANVGGRLVSRGAIPNKLTGMTLKTHDDAGKRYARPLLIVTAVDGGTFAYATA